LLTSKCQGVNYPLVFFLNMVVVVNRYLRYTGSYARLGVVVLVLLSLFLFSPVSRAQRQMEELGRGLVAVQVPGGIFLSWRIPGVEWHGVTYHVYRNGQRITAEPLRISNFTDPDGSATSSYSVTAVVNDEEQAPCGAVQPWAQQYREIPLKPRNTSIYQVNDATAADLDGDGEYEIIVKRIAPGWNDDNKHYSFFEAYKLDGTFLWEINVGPNILPDVEINIAAFDFDGDGKAEVFMRTSEGTVFGDGAEIGDTDNDQITNYRFSVGTTANMQYMNKGPEFLSLIDGLTGKELDRIPFIPRGESEDWGDGYGHRASKYFFGAPYLDGKKPSLFIGRGIYTKTIMRTYDVVNKKLVFRWEFHSGTSGPWFGQGNHNFTVADVDGDGRDEIVWGSMTIDDDGRGLYSTRLGHGDAMHVGDLDPFRKGIEAFRCLENYPDHGTVFHDAATGEILIHHTIDKDCGRCCAANISDDIRGKALWGGARMYSASTREVTGTSGGPENFRIYWDGDLLEELLDHSGFSTATGYGTGAIYKYGRAEPLLLAQGAISCNYTKGTPSLQADLFGDWREEVIWRNQANTAIRIYTTVNPTLYRVYTLMHDHQYRQAVCWQMCGYNQPPHVSYFLGVAEGKTEPPPPALSNGRLVYNGTGIWDHSSVSWMLDGTAASFKDGDHVLFDSSSGDQVTLLLDSVTEPSVLSVNSPGNLMLLAGAGKLTGGMELSKNGAGTLTLAGTHDYSGDTRIWGGTFNFSGELPNSPVWMGFFGEMNASGILGKGLTLSYGSLLRIGKPDSVGNLLVSGHLTLGENAGLIFDLSPAPAPASDSLVVNGPLLLSENAVFKINALLPHGVEKLPPGDYLLVTYAGDLSGDISKVRIEGMQGTPCRLKTDGKKIFLEVQSVRSAARVYWNGDKPGGVWDLALTENFLAGGKPDIFVTGDTVFFTDAAISKTVILAGEVCPVSMVVDATGDYRLKGTGKISGSAGLTKSGTGTLAIENANEFTGRVLVSEGTLSLSKMPTTQAPGGIGPANALPSAFELNGGTLLVNGENSSNRAILMGANGGTIRNTATLTLHEPVAGGVLTKTGTGNLVLAGVNTHTRTIMKEGRITLLNDNTNPGKTIVLEGGTLQCSDNSSSYNTLPWNIEVPAGKTASIMLDSRGYYTGTLKGGGNLYMYIPFVRSDLNGDMSGFSGTLNVFSTYSNSQGYSAELRINHSKGLPNALVNINTSIWTSNTAGTTVVLGALSGAGELGGNETWQIGSKGINTEFKGRITAGSLIKMGIGELKLSGSNSYTGGTTVMAGTLHVNNSSGSATGSGNVTVRKDAVLTGPGTIAGGVTVEEGAVLRPGSANTGYKTTVNGAVNLKPGSVFSIRVNPLFKICDALAVTGTLAVSGHLSVNNSTATELQEGDRFKIFEAGNITGSFTSVTPEIPGEGLEWDFSELLSGGIVKVTRITSVSFLQRDQFAVTPNPAEHLLKLRLPVTGNRMTVEIAGINRQVYKKEYYDHAGVVEMDVSGLPSGVYFVILQAEGKREVRKIVKL